MTIPLADICPFVVSLRGLARAAGCSTHKVRFILEQVGIHPIYRGRSVHYYNTSEIVSKFPALAQRLESEYVETGRLAVNVEPLRMVVRKCT